MLTLVVVARIFTFKKKYKDLSLPAHKTNQNKLTWETKWVSHNKRQ